LSALRPLLVIAIILTASGFASDILGEYLGPIDYKGYLVFDYPEGENPITNIVFNVDSSLADSLIIVSVPSIWSYSYGGGVLTLSSGSLSPGGSVRVTVSLNKYFEDGEYLVTSVGTTTAGEVSQASGPLLVGEMYLLNFIAMASAYRFPLSALVAGLGFLEWYLRRRLIEKPFTPNKPLTQSDLDKIRDILPDDLPEGGKVVVTPGMGVTSDGDLIHLDDNVSMPKSFTEQSGLEVETPDIDYRTGTDSGPSSRKMGGVNEHTNITMKRDKRTENIFESIYADDNKKGSEYKSKLDKGAEDKHTHAEYDPTKDPESKMYEPPDKSLSGIMDKPLKPEYDPTKDPESKMYEPPDKSLSGIMDKPSDGKSILDKARASKTKKTETK
jgi:hypothetical protein